MHLKRYRSNSVSDALARARAELGPDALVLSTRLVASGGWRGWLGGREVEVTAAANRVVSVNRPARPDSLQSAPEAPQAQATPPQIVTRSETSSDSLAARLRAAGIDRRLAAEVAASVPRLQRRHASLAMLKRAVADHLEALAAGDEAFAAVEVFVGPPGVGKTTMIAKIAAQERARRGVRLGLVSADGFRVGAVEQLRVYADVIGAPFGVARTPAELSRVLTDVAAPALVDTAGRSPVEDQSRELLTLLAACREVRTHVVLSAATAPRDAARLLDAYAAVRPSRVALTRVDEAESVGELVALLRERHLPVSYLGTGQRVPEDLTRATASVLADLLVGDAGAARGVRA